MLNPDANAEISKPTSRYLKSGLVAFAASGNKNIDKENGIIYNVIMCQVGPAKGHGVNLEQEFIEDGIAYAVKHWSKVGLKSRFGHPNMSNDALGTEIGRFKNFRVEDDKMIADLHLYESANLSPGKAGMKDWLLSMAEEDPLAIMCSIVFTPDHYYQKDENGDKVRVWENDDKGNWVSANNKMPIYVAMGQLQATDIVDEGAATDRLFSAEINKDKYAVIATEFFDQHPDVLQFLKDNPEKFPQFIQVYEAYQQKKNQPNFFMKKIFMSCAALIAALGFTGKSEAEVPEVTEDLLKELDTKFSEKEQALASAQQELAALTSEKEQWSKDKTALETKLADAEKQSKANLDLAESFRAAAGEGFSAAEQKKTDDIPGAQTDEVDFSSYAHNQEALNEIKNF